MAESNTTSNLSTPQPTKSLAKMDTKVTLAIMAKLAETISLRAGQASPGYLKLMAQRLSRENYNYVMQALVILEERERGEGETTVLDLATILKEIRLLTPRQKTRVEIEEDVIAEERRKAIREVGSE